MFEDIQSWAGCRSWRGVSTLKQYVTCTRLASSLCQRQLMPVWWVETSVQHPKCPSQKHQVGRFPKRQADRPNLSCSLSRQKPNALAQTGVKAMALRPATERHPSSSNSTEATLLSSVRCNCSLRAGTQSKTIQRSDVATILTHLWASLILGEACSRSSAAWQCHACRNVFFVKVQV